MGGGNLEVNIPYTDSTTLGPLVRGHEFCLKLLLASGFNRNQKSIRQSCCECCYYSEVENPPRSPKIVLWRWSTTGFNPVFICNPLGSSGAPSRPKLTNKQIENKLKWQKIKPTETLSCVLTSIVSFASRSMHWTNNLEKKHSNF